MRRVNMAKPNEVVADEAMMLIEVTYNAHIAIPASKAALLNDIQVWIRKYDSDSNAHVVSRAKGDDAHPRVHLIPADQIVAAKMLAAMAAKETK
jgi:hypothetical protein